MVIIKGLISKLVFVVFLCYPVLFVFPCVTLDISLGRADLQQGKMCGILKVCKGRKQSKVMELEYYSDELC